MNEPIGTPVDPAGWRLLVEAYADGELDAAMVLAVEARLAADPDLAAHHARIVALREAVGRLPAVPVGDDFAARIAALTPPPVTVIPTAISPSRRYDWRQWAASIVVTAILAGGLGHYLGRAPSQDPILGEIAGGHRRALLAASPIDIASSDRHTVKPWLDARIGVSPPAVDLSADGFVLLGGRVEIIGGRPVPALAYRHNEHLVTLVALPLGSGIAAPQDLSADGFSMVRFADAAFTYYAVSDMDRAELDRFAERFSVGAAKG